MTVLIVLGSILAFFLLISLLRVGINVEFSEDGILVLVMVGPIGIKIYPAEKKKKKKKPKEKKKKKKEAEEEKKKPGLLTELKSYWPAIKKTLLRLKRKLLIKELTIYYLAAGPDPAQAALSFGGISAAFGIITAVFENNFRIKKRDLRTAVDFEAEEPYIYIKVKLSLAVWEAVYVVSNLLTTMAKNKNQTKSITTTRKAV